MNQTADRKKRNSVVCLFCGLDTPAPENRFVDDPRVFIIRCQRCGKEAPYSAKDAQDLADSQTPKVRVVGMN